MLTTTTNTIDGRRITQYFGIVSGEASFGANISRDFFGRVRDVVGVLGNHQKSVGDLIDTAIAEMVSKAQQSGADAVIGVDIDYESGSSKGGVLFTVIATGTAVRLE